MEALGEGYRLYVRIQALICFVIMSFAGQYVLRYTLRHRQHIAVKNRGAITCLWQIAAMVLSCCGYQLVHMANLPCGVYMLFMVTFGNAVFISYLQRIVIAYGLFVLTKRAQENADRYISPKVGSSADSSPVSADGELAGFKYQMPSKLDEWIGRHAQEIRQETKLTCLSFVILLLYAFFQVLILLFVHLSGDTDSTKDVLSAPFFSTTCQQKAQFYVNRLVFGQIVLALCFLSRLTALLRTLEENFGVLDEFKGYLKTGLANGSSVFFAFILEFAFNDPNLQNICQWIFISLAPIMHLYIMWKSISKFTEHFQALGDDDTESRDSQRLQGVQAVRLSRRAVLKESKAQLEQFIHNEELFKPLEKFLALEFSVENGYFLREVKRYFEVRNPVAGETLSDDAEHIARSIFTQYCATDAEKGINVSSEVREQLQKAIADLNENSMDEEILLRVDQGFQAAKEQILVLMAKDSWTRFRQTEEYKKMTVTTKDSNEE
jgi:hypothetical protein